MSDYAYRVLSISLATAVTDMAIEIEGSVIMHLTGTADIEVKLNDRGQDKIYLSPRDKIILPPGLTFKKFFVSGSAGGGTVTLFVGRPNMMIDAGQVYIAGDVNVGRDKGWYYQSEEAKAFNIVGYRAAQSGQFSCVQAYNPSGSDIVGKIRKFSVNASQAGLVGYGMSNDITGFAAYAYGVNKYLGGTAGKMRSYTDVDAAPHMTGGNLFGYLYCPANQVVSHEFKDAIIVPEGYAFCVEEYTTNNALYLFAEYTEDV